MLSRAWARLKKWKKAPLGPVTLVYRFERTARITQPRHAQVEFAPRTKVSDDVSDLTGAGGVAAIVGVGPGFGHGVARALAAEGLDVVMVCRDALRLEALVSELRQSGLRASAYGCDATHESDVARLFEEIAAKHGPPALVIYSVQGSGPGTVVDVTTAAFEEAWRQNCFGAFLVGAAAARCMAPRGQGSIFFIGSTSSIIGREGHLNLAVGKFGQRALAQVLARELWSAGVHVAHVMIDADIAEDEGSMEDRQAHPGHIAQAILHLHRQPRGAWTSEMDLRPAQERFWEHC